MKFLSHRDKSINLYYWKCRPGGLLRLRVLLANWGSMPVACISNPSASGQFASKPYITTDENVLKNLSSS
jgi:hypothetical protein